MAWIRDEEKSVTQLLGHSAKTNDFPASKGISLMNRTFQGLHPPTQARVKHTNLLVQNIPIQCSYTHYLDFFIIHITEVPIMTFPINMHKNICGATCSLTGDSVTLLPFRNLANETPRTVVFPSGLNKSLEGTQ